ncbi:MAG: phosphocholine cytidylyltransferase family protein [Bacteroidales bacterium]|nr:phosphocholine cytidylyltransferase family protein [Bacteroidales bacterium]
MQAVILAAGMGSRLGNLTENDAKCMVPVNGVRLIDRMICQLRQSGIRRIIVVVGYEGDRLRNYLANRYQDMDMQFVDNPIFDTTNNIYSLWLANEWMRLDDTLLLESDLVIDIDMLRDLIESPAENAALVSPYETWNDGTMVTMDADNNITSFIPKKNFHKEDCPKYYKTVNIYKFSRKFLTDSYLPSINAYMEAKGRNDYYEQVLCEMTASGQISLKGISALGHRWYEIDTVEDLAVAERIVD